MKGKYMYTTIVVTIVTVIVIALLIILYLSIHEGTRSRQIDNMLVLKLRSMTVTLQNASSKIDQLMLRVLKLVSKPSRKP